MSGKRYQQVDIAKGICMIIVVFAHSFILPLFFFLFGLVFSKALIAARNE